MISANSCPSKESSEIVMAIGTFLPDACITGLRVRVWRIKPSTGHDEKEDSLSANRLRKLATGTEFSCYRVVNKKHHQPKGTQLLYLCRRARPCHNTSGYCGRVSGRFSFAILTKKSANRRYFY